MPSVPVRYLLDLFIPLKSIFFFLTFPSDSSGVIDDKPLRFRGEVYHPYHFNCSTCGVELNSDAREVRSRPGYAANEMVRIALNVFQKKILI